MYKLVNDGEQASTVTNGQALLTFAQTLWGEARGEGYIGMTAVACVILNRASNPRWWGGSVYDVCTKHTRQGIYQFSCWVPVGSDYEAMQKLTFKVTGEAAPAGWDDAVSIALSLATYKGSHNDITFGADAYANLHECSPAWADPSKQTVVIGNHTFFALELTPLSRIASSTQIASEIAAAQATQKA